MAFENVNSENQRILYASISGTKMTFTEDCDGIGINIIGAEKDSLDKEQLKLVNFIATNFDDLIKIKIL